MIPENGSDVLAAFIGTGTTAINNCGRAGYEALQARFTFQNGVCAPRTSCERVRWPSTRRMKR